MGPIEDGGDRLDYEGGEGGGDCGRDNCSNYEDNEGDDDGEFGGGNGGDVDGGGDSGGGDGGGGGGGGALQEIIRGSPVQQDIAQILGEPQDATHQRSKELSFQQQGVSSFVEPTRQGNNNFARQSYDTDPPTFQFNGLSPSTVLKHENGMSNARLQLSHDISQYGGILPTNVLEYDNGREEEVIKAVPPNLSFLPVSRNNNKSGNGGEDENKNEVGGQGLGQRVPIPGWDFVHINHSDDEEEDNEDDDDQTAGVQVPPQHNDDSNFIDSTDDEEEDDEDDDDQTAGVQVQVPPQHNDDSNFIDSTWDDSMAATQHQSRINKLKNPPPNWEQSSLFQKIFKCDIDGLKITGKIEIISAIMGDDPQLTISDRIVYGKQTTGNMLLVATKPYYMYVKEESKEDIIAVLDDIRKVPHPPATNKHALLKKTITMVASQFEKVLKDALVDSVTIVGYSQKAPLKWGQKKMSDARGVDSNCTCEFDLAASIPPEQMHWARYDDHHMAPVDFSEDGINQLQLMTLVCNTSKEGIESKFGKKAKVEHWPQFCMAQLEFYGFKIPPIYGSLNILPRGVHKAHNKTRSYQGEYDVMEVDDEESTNNDEDYDGTHGESNLKN